MDTVWYGLAERIRPSFPSSRFPGLLISNLAFSNTKLGRGADATVYEAEWNGTPCAAKRLHEILLEDESPGGTEKLLSNFERECMTWSKLRHPGVVQFLGVYLERGSRLPVLIMEKMDTSLRRYLEDHNKEAFSLHLKAFVLRQVTQALAYLHNQNPPLVHHDLSSNNVLLNVVSFVTKISDFGMSRAICVSSSSRKSTVKGTWAFLPPEALQSPPQYNEKLDVFSFGNIILSALTHEWPDPKNPTVYDGEQLKALNELERRAHHVARFSAQENYLLLPTVRQCLENRPDKRPSSVMLVQELRRIESTLQRSGYVAAPINQLSQQLAAKEVECRQRDEALREKDEAIRELGNALNERDTTIAHLQQQRRYLHVPELTQEDWERLVTTRPIRNWKDIGKCQRIIKHSAVGGLYNALVVNKDGLIAVTDNQNRCVHLMTANGLLVRTDIGKNQLGGTLQGVACDEKGDIWLSDTQNNRVVKYSQDGNPLLQISHLSHGQEYLSHPTRLTVSGNGCLYVCDHENLRVSAFDSQGKFLFKFGDKIEDGKDVKLSSDCLYIYDPVNHRVCTYREDGTFLREFDYQGTDLYVHIAPTNDGHLIVASPQRPTVEVYTTEGQLVCEFGSVGSEPGQFGGIWGGVSGVAVGSAGRVYVSDCRNKRIQAF